MQVTVNDSIADIAPAAWNELAGSDYPFLRHEFLALGESTGCVSPDRGWTPQHLSIHEGKCLRAAMPLYLKTHSWGEFVFDWAWANAYEQAGLAYYPKLVSATPFTPAPGPRLLVADPDDTDARRALVEAAIAAAERRHCSSLHIQFPLEEELAVFEDSGLLIRRDCQFHWHNRDYRSFDDFLETFTAVKRKKVRRERRRIAEAGIRFAKLRGGEMSDERWATVYRLISRTFIERGSLPYYNDAFFAGLAKHRPDDILVILAERGDRPIAASVFYVGEGRLYGRYWGSDEYVDSLHFETCYYQGIDYCIENALQIFEPGTQGEHKISRGFTPVSTFSAHWLAHPEFANAIERYLDEEGRHVDRYMDAVDSHSPYKGDGQ